MKKDYIIISEAISLSKVSESTVRRWISRHKDNKNIVYKDNGIYHMKSSEFIKDYPNISDYSHDKHEQSKEIAEFTLEKQQKDIFQHNQELLNKTLNKPFYRLPVLWVSLGFIILIIVFGGLGYIYRNELINNQKSKISEVTSFKDEIIKSKETNLKETKKALEETKTAYQQTLKTVDLLHAKYNDKIDNERKLLSVKEATINRLQSELDKLNKKLKENDTESH